MEFISVLVEDRKMMPLQLKRVPQCLIPRLHTGSLSVARRKHSVSSSGNVKNDPGTENVFHGSCGESSAPFYSWNSLQTCYSPHFSASISRVFLHVRKFLGLDQNSAGQNTGFQGSHDVRGCRKATAAWFKYVWKRIQTSPVTNIIESPASVNKEAKR